MKGPILTAENAGINVEGRDVIWAKIQNTAEGSLFTATDIVGDDKQMRRDFDDLLGYDHHHVFRDYHTAVIETPSLRRWPNLHLLVVNYVEKSGTTIVPTGDRISYDLKLRGWETLDGVRYYTDGEDTVINNGRMKIRFIQAPKWLRQDDTTSVLLRVFHDQSEKTLTETCVRALRDGEFSKDDLIKVCDLADQVSEEHFSDENQKKSNNFSDPKFISTGIRTWLDDRAKNSKENTAGRPNV